MRSVTLANAAIGTVSGVVGLAGGTRRQETALPPPYTGLAVDTHAHVFVQGLALAATRRHSPEHDATTADYLALLDAHGCSHGVLVQPSFLGSDNSFLVRALRSVLETSGLRTIGTSRPAGAQPAVADVVIATEHASFATPEVTLGLPPAQIAPFVWQRLGESAARQCLLQGLNYTASQAQQVGLVNELIDEESDAAWGKTLTRLMRAAPGAVASTKQLLRSLRGPVPDMRNAAAHAFASGLRSAEAAQGLAAFARKQPAPWTLSDKDKA